MSDGAADLSQAMTQALRMVGYSKDFKSVAVQVDGLEAPLPVPAMPVASSRCSSISSSTPPAP